MFKVKYILLTSLAILTSCYNGDKTLIPRQPFEPVEVEEGYSLVFEPKVDILFVIDDSGSMSDAQSQLAQNISLFAQAMEQNKFLDYHMGVISTSFGSTYEKQSGQLQGNPKFVARDTPDGLVRFQRTILDLGTYGNYLEKMFDPLHVAIDPSTPANAGFFRSEAFAVIIIISDTFDQSEIYSGFSVYNNLINAKAYDTDKVLGYGVLSYPSFFRDQCTQDGYDDPKNLFSFLGLFTNALNSQIGGGVTSTIVDPSVPAEFHGLTNVFSLCDPNFGPKIAEIGEDIRLRVSQKIPLPVRPVDGTIKLKYGTQEIDKKWWKYDFGTNSIILDPLVELDDTQVDAQLFVVMDQASADETIGDPSQK